MEQLHDVPNDLVSPRTDSTTDHSTSCTNPIITLARGLASNVDKTLPDALVLPHSGSYPKVLYGLQTYQASRDILQQAPGANIDDSFPPDSPPATSWNGSSQSGEAYLVDTVTEQPSCYASSLYLGPERLAGRYARHTYLPHCAEALPWSASRQARYVAGPDEASGNQRTGSCFPHRVVPRSRRVPSTSFDRSFSQLRLAEELHHTRGRLTRARL